jgi:hypothetical protein
MTATEYLERKVGDVIDEFIPSAHTEPRRAMVVSIPGHDWIEAVVHTQAGTPRWVCTEITSRHAIAYGKSVQTAIVAAHQTIERVGVEKAKKAIATACEGTAK